MTAIMVPYSRRLTANSRTVSNRKIFSHRLLLIFFINPIPHPSDGFDTVNAQLLADILDVGIDDLIVPDIIIIPDDV